jgi:hypothetical protein
MLLLLLLLMRMMMMMMMMMMALSSLGILLWHLLAPGWGSHRGRIWEPCVADAQADSFCDVLSRALPPGQVSCPDRRRNLWCAFLAVLQPKKMAES